MIPSSAVVLRAETLAQPGGPLLSQIEPRCHADHSEDRDRQYDQQSGIHE
jgi:hypothetical protein